MSIPLNEVTAETRCPERLGGDLHHYPFTRDGKAVTMPGPDTDRYGLTKPVMLALCMTARKPVYLVAPRAKPDPANPSRTCAECAYEHFLDLRRAKEDQLVVAV
ncbi:hypothetical protein [Actinophytocola sediminis]